MILSHGVGRALTALLALGACADADDGGDADDGDIRVVATTDLWADLTRHVGCEGPIEVRPLMPSGADPHAYEPSLRDRETLDGADLVVANGLGFEALLTDTLDDVADAGVPVIDVAGEGDDDPHVWFDPTRMHDAIPILGDALVAAGADRATIDRCVAATQELLAAVDADVTAILAEVPADERDIVTNHDALNAFARRYDFSIVGSVLPSSSTLAESSPRALADLGDTIRDAGVTAVFVEAGQSAADAEALADRLGLEVVDLYTDGLGPPGSDAATYAGMMRENATAIAQALTP